MSNKFDFLGKPDGPTSYYYSTADGSNSKTNSCGGIQIISVPPYEQGLEIYSLLEKNCDVIFCKSEEAVGFTFSCKEQFAVFATNGRGDLYGTIGGIGDMEDDNYPIGYVSREGCCGRIANNLKEFFRLVVFYPFWLDLLHCPEGERWQTAELSEKKWAEAIPSYFENQKKIADILNIEKSEASIDTLFLNIGREPYFEVYGAAGEQKLYI